MMAKQPVALLITMALFGCGYQLRLFAAPDAQAGVPNRPSVEQWEPPASIRKLLASLIPESFSPDGNRFATKSRGKRVRVWDFRTGRLLYSLPQTEGAVVFSHNGRVLANGAEIRDAATGRLRRRMPEPNREDAPSGQAAEAAAFSPDDRKLCSGYRVAYPDGPESYHAAEFRVWDIRTGQLHRKIDSTGPPMHVSADFRLVASGGGVFTDRGPWISSTVLYSIQSGKRLSEMPHRSNAIAFSPDGRKLALSRADEVDNSQYDHLLLMVDTSSGVIEWKTEPVNESAGDVLAFSPDGKVLAVAGPSYSNPTPYSVRFLDSATGKSQAEFGGDEHSIDQMVFHPTRRILVTCCRTCGMKFWNLGRR